MEKSSISANSTTINGTETAHATWRYWARQEVGHETSPIRIVTMDGPPSMLNAGSRLMRSLKV